MVVDLTPGLISTITETMRRNLRQRLRSKLSRRIVFYVFVSVIVIETIILIPSYMKREQDLIEQMRRESAARVEVLMSLVPEAAADKTLMDQTARLIECPVISGGLLYTARGEKIGSFGEMPELSFSDVDRSDVLTYQSPGHPRVDLAWTPVHLGRDYVLILRHKAGAVRQELLAYTLRIAGLVIIISIFVTVGAWIALNPLVVDPVLYLREDLIEAGEAISKDREKPNFHSASVRRDDELGEVIRAFNRMYAQISDAVIERKKAEKALQRSLEQLAAYSRVLDEELERGRKMQANFLPQVLPRRSGWELASFFRPARRVAGDFYDAFDLPDERIGLVIADVCDKGVGAALFMALFRSLIRIFSGQATLQGLECSLVPEPADAVRPESGGDEAAFFAEALRAVHLTNDYIVNNHEDLGMFVTLFFGVLDPESGSLAYINSGHDPLYLIDPEGSIRRNLTPTGPAVGIQSHPRMQIQNVQIRPGEILFGYTDGVTEARSADGTFFSERRLMVELRRGAASAGELLERVAAALQSHVADAEPFDDITMLAVCRKPSTR